MAWSGDVLYSNLWSGYTNLYNVFPEGGALIWIDNMLIPAQAANPVGAMEVMDFYYQPEIAKLVTEWVVYLSPVPATQDLILQDAQKAEEQGDKGFANKLKATAENPYAYPPPEFLSNSSFGRQLKTDDERNEWNSIFLPISQG
jgi:spermidine/putrescine transport system substrate-binding protein